MQHAAQAYLGAGRARPLHVHVQVDHQLCQQHAPLQRQLLSQLGASGLRGRGWQGCVWEWGTWCGNGTRQGNARRGSAAQTSTPTPRAPAAPPAVAPAPAHLLAAAQREERGGGALQQLHRPQRGVADAVDKQLVLAVVAHRLCARAPAGAEGLAVCKVAAAIGGAQGSRTAGRVGKAGTLLRRACRNAHGGALLRMLLSGPATTPPPTRDQQLRHRGRQQRDEPRPEVGVVAQ